MFKNSEEAFENMSHRAAKTLLEKKIKRDVRKAQKATVTVCNCGLQQPRQKVIDRNMKYLLGVN